MRKHETSAIVKHPRSKVNIGIPIRDYSEFVVFWNNFIKMEVLPRLYIVQQLILAFSKVDSFPF